MTQHIIDLQRLDIKEQSPSYTYIGLDENNELVRTTISSNDVDLSNYYTKQEINNKGFVTDSDVNDYVGNEIGQLEEVINTKQTKLVSGENIKTINGQSILGEGNLTIEGGDVDLSDYYTKQEMNEYINKMKENTDEIDGLKSYKQDKLQDGYNIKTINGQSILGEGDLTIEGGSGGGSAYALYEIGGSWTTQEVYNAFNSGVNCYIQNTDGSIGMVDGVYSNGKTGYLYGWMPSKTTRIVNRFQCTKSNGITLTNIPDVNVTDALVECIIELNDSMAKKEFYVYYNPSTNTFGPLDIEWETLQELVENDSKFDLIIEIDETNRVKAFDINCLTKDLIVNFSFIWENKLFNGVFDIPSQNASVINNYYTKNEIDDIIGDIPEGGSGGGIEPYSFNINDTQWEETPDWEGLKAIFDSGRPMIMRYTNDEGDVNICQVLGWTATQFWAIGNYKGFDSIDRLSIYYGYPDRVFCYSKIALDTELETKFSQLETQIGDINNVLESI